MTCEWIDLGDGARAVVCSRGKRAKVCKACHRRAATKLCDWPLTGKKTGRTCDMALCDGCAVAAGPGKDHCPAHAKMAPQCTLPLGCVR